MLKSKQSRNYPGSQRTVELFSKALKVLFIISIKAYQCCISPLLGTRCRFYPSCSHYAITALSRFGIPYGLWLSFCRILKCHPFHRGGIDSVPERKG